MPRNPKRLVVGLKGSLKAGAYKASWTIGAGDGHIQRGSFRSKLRK
jgi:methionine-rich copper-binding protein CopC